MIIRIISVIITLFFLVIVLSGCGVSSPTGTAGFGSAAGGVPGPTGISFSAVFPARLATTASGPNALISASTTTIKISIRDTAGNVFGSATVTSASPNAMIPVTGYAGAVKVYITSYDSAGGLTASHIHDASIYSGMTTPISVALVEFRQGVAGIPGTPLLRAPDYSSYTLNDLFLAPTGTSYQLGIKATKAAAAGYHLSTQNMDQTTLNGTNPPNVQLLVVNDNLSFPIDVPNAAKTVWNRYQININFMNGTNQSGTPIPTASPTVTGAFIGAFSAPNTPVPIAIPNFLNGITWSGTQFVVVGATGTILTSPDGITWTQRTTPATAALNAIASGSTQFVVVGATGTILTSPDGITWTPRTSPTANALSSVTWSGALFVAVDGNGGIYTSPNGITWTAQTSNTAQGLSAVIWSGTQFVVVGGGGVILTSPNGIAWTIRTSNTTALLKGIVWSGTQFVIVGNAILTSPDGITWTLRTSPTIATMPSVTWTGTKFVAVGMQDTIITSPDGITWTLGSSGLTTLSFMGVTSSPTKVVAVGEFGTIITSTDSGATWSGNAQGGVGFSIPTATWSAYNVPPIPLASASIIF